jgi:hypothetical protein
MPGRAQILPGKRFPADFRAFAAIFGARGTIAALRLLRRVIGDASVRAAFWAQ